MLLNQPKKHEIDHRTLKLLVGVIALTLGNITAFFSDTRITSISAAYHAGGWAQSFLVGFLFAIAAFLLAYNGYSKTEMVLSKVAALAALGVALFPCGCDNRDQIIPHVHFASAAVMFSILTYFCVAFYRRARARHFAEADRRAWVYALCAVVLALSIATLVLDTVLGGKITESVPRLVFYCERAGLVAFGVCWLTASRILPALSSKQERAELFSGAPETS